MKKIFAIFSVSILSIFSFINILQAQSAPDVAPDNPVVVELFTSQSCSSCPPADKILGEISDNPNIIALGFHVTYWDHLHWKDTLSQEFATNRQRAYAHNKSRGRVYTPQMIVNGGAQFVGSNRGKLQNALSKAHSIKSLQISKAGNDFTFDAPAMPAGQYHVWIYGTQKKHLQDIPSGENKGRSVTYSNSVMAQIDGGAWDGKAQSFTFAALPNDQIDDVIVLIQKDGYGDIIAAGKRRFAGS